MNNFYPLLSALLLKNGWAIKRQGKGSHEIWGKDGEKSITVPRTTKSRHTVNGILKDAGIDEKL